MWINLRFLGDRKPNNDILKYVHDTLTIGIPTLRSCQHSYPILHTLLLIWWSWIFASAIPATPDWLVIVCRVQWNERTAYDEIDQRL